jgi:hypothetical protein
VIGICFSGARHASPPPDGECAGAGPAGATAGCRGSRLAGPLGCSGVSGELETAVKGKDERRGEGRAHQGDLGLRGVTKLLSGVADQIGREINPHVLRRPELMKRKSAGDPFLTRVLTGRKIFVVGDPHEFEALAG